ncbi:hypothetical protein Trydic_g11434 [Trypoxylus dichotomus]
MLHIFIQGRARLTSYKPTNGPDLIIRSHGVDYKKLLKELNVRPITARNGMEKGLHVKAESTGIEVRIWETRPKINYRCIAMYSDNQAVIKALDATQTKLRLAWNCMNVVNRLRGRTKVDLAWIPGRKNHRDNVKASSSANRRCFGLGGLKTGGRVFQVRDRPRSLWLEEKTAVHVLCDCTALVGIRLLGMGIRYPKAETHAEGSSKTTTI